MRIDRRSFIAAAGLALACPRAAFALDIAATGSSLPDKAMGTGAQTLYVYMSMGCPSCAEFHRKTIAEVRRVLADAGRLRIVYREFPLDGRSYAAAMLARQAGDRYFEALDLLFAEQAFWMQAKDSGAAFRTLAARLGLPPGIVGTVATDRPLFDGIAAIRKHAIALGVSGTPTLFVQGEMYEGGLPAPVLISRFG